MDDELKSLLNRFDGGSTITRAIVDHAKDWNKSLKEVSAEAVPLIQDFVKRTVLTQTPGNYKPAEEPVEIANVTLNLTNRCNLNCGFCYNAGLDKPAVSVEKLSLFIKNAQSDMSKDASLIILGGEPTLVPDRLFYLLDSVGDIFSQAPMISTNGTRLSRDIVKKFSDRRVEVQVSLDSHDSKVHDAGRGKGVFHRAITGIQRLVDAGVYTIVSMVYKQSNIQDMEGYLNLAMSLGVNEARFIPLRRVGAAKNYQESEQPDQLAVFEHLLDILDRKPKLSELLKRDFFSIAMLQCRTSTSRVSCGIGRRVIFIDADGGIYPCPNHVTPDFLLGGVGTDTLYNILNKNHVMRGLRERYHVNRYTQCSKCAFKHWCAGDCRGEVLALTGIQTAPSPHCEQLFRMYTRILWLIAQGDTRLNNMAANSNRKDVKDTFLF
ncbi:MAG: radical SAM protein [Deltaproteobacteria bacterium]|nr:radical SAM protein [Deltaproteobacteria bacterium]